MRTVLIALVGVLAGVGCSSENGTADAALDLGPADQGTVDAAADRGDHDAGAEGPQSLSRGELVRCIREAGREPVERDTLYRVVETPA